MALSLTKPCLLVALHLNGKTKVCQLHCCSLHLTGQQEVLWLQQGTQKKTYSEESKDSTYRYYVIPLDLRYQSYFVEIHKKKKIMSQWSH